MPDESRVHASHADPATVSPLKVDAGIPANSQGVNEPAMIDLLCTGNNEVEAMSGRPSIPHGFRSVFIEIVVAVGTVRPSRREAATATMARGLRRSRPRPRCQRLACSRRPSQASTRITAGSPRRSMDRESCYLPTALCLTSIPIPPKASIAVYVGSGTAETRNPMLRYHPVGGRCCDSTRAARPSGVAPLRRPIYYKK